MSQASEKNLLTPKQTAERIGVKVSTLAVWRCTQRYDLPYHKVGRCIRYRPQDVDAFIERVRVNPQTA